MEVLKNFDKQRTLIEKRIREMDEESAIVQALMSRLTYHALHMRKNLIKATSPQMFLKMFSKINEILSKYVIIMTEISCKMEKALFEEVFYWNSSYGSSSFTIKPLASCSNNMGDDSRSKKQNSEKNLSTKKPLESKLINCMKNIRDNAENFSNHQLPLSSTNLTSDKELTLSNGSSSKNSSVIKKEKFSIEEFNVAKLTEKDYYGHIEHAVSPSELYVYFATSDIFLMEEFDKEILALSEDAGYKSSNHSYSKTQIRGPCERKRKAMEELGDYALYFSEVDSLFYRAKIMDWNLSSNNDLIDVFFIDYGNKMNVSIDSVYPVPENLRKYPAFTVRCHLCDIVSQYGDVEWTPSETQILKKWIEENEKVVIVIGENQSDPSNSLPISVYDAKERNNLNSLIRESRSIGNGIEWSEVGGEEEKENVLKEWNPMQEAHDSHLNSYEINIDHPAIPVYGHVPTDDRRLCKIYRETGKCYKGAGCRKEHVMLDEKGYTTDQEEIFTNSFTTLDEPNVGDVLNVRVTYIENGCEFYCVKESRESECKEETLESLVSYMNTEENFRGMKKLKIPPSIGQVVISKFPRDNCWYRAKVLEVSPENDEYLVLYVDYGNTETVGFSSLRAIEPRYLHFPFQAMLCKIDGIRIRCGAEKEAVKFLDDNLPVNVVIRVTATFPGERPHLIVKLSSTKHRDVGRLLLKEKYAERKENFILDESQKLLPG